MMSAGLGCRMITDIVGRAEWPPEGRGCQRRHCDPNGTGGQSMVELRDSSDGALDSRRNTPRGPEHLPRRGPLLNRERLTPTGRTAYVCCRRDPQSYIRHALNLQLDGQKVPRSPEALRSGTNVSLGSQIRHQLPVGRRVPVIDIEAMP